MDELEQYAVGTPVRIKRTKVLGTVREGSWSRVTEARGCVPAPEPAYLVGEETWYWHHELELVAGPKGDRFERVGSELV